MATNRSRKQAPSSSPSIQSTVESSRIIAETASDAIITINEQSTILFVNGATSNIFGYSAEELIGSQLTMLMPESLRHLHTAGLHNYLETGHKHISWEAVELPGLHKSGKQLLLELSFGEFEKDGHRFFTGIARDIGRRKHDERRLKVQLSTTEILAGAASLQEAAPRLLEAIATTMGWQFAAFWTVQAELNQLQAIASWRDESCPGIVEFSEASGHYRMSGDQSFPDRIATGKQTIWLGDFGSDETYPRAGLARRGNLH